MGAGTSQIGFERGSQNNQTFQGYDPGKGELLDDIFYVASDAEIKTALQKAEHAYKIYKRKSGGERAGFLDTIADEILALGDELIARACEESGLPEARITGERGRTVNQLKMFANSLREGSWVNAIIDTALPERAPVPRPDLRTLSIPVGPVLVFTASNFPLAFSTAGGDTASALAAGNPVIVKSHESHPGTNELVAGAIAKAAKSQSMPDGVFSSLNGVGFDLGTTLVQHESIKSVAFTGSYQGGVSLMNLASQRKTPIPVFAEMGSTNPVVIFPDALKQDAEALGSQLAGSIMMGAGQFCTNPGIMVLPQGENTDQFLRNLASDVSAANAQTMLNQGIQKNYETNFSNMLEQDGVELVAESNDSDAGTSGMAGIARVSARTFLENPTLAEEVFGPSSLAIICEQEDDLRKFMATNTGQLTATAICTEKDVEMFSDLMIEMGELAGRLVFNGVPTGVEVSDSMHHGGPFPASTDARFTSVGTEAIKRFVRPLCYQDAPHSILPLELQDENPLKIWRKVNGDMTNGRIE